MALEAYRKSKADRELQNMLDIQEKADLITATRIHSARAEGEARGRAEG